MGHIKNSLLECTNHYALFGNDSGVNPLSKFDAEIITQFFEIIIKLGADDNLVSLVNQYKQCNDVDFLALLETYNSHLQETYKIPLINIKDQFIGNVNFISSFTQGSYYNVRLHKSTPILIINKSENKQVPYANTQITFNSDKELDEEMKKIKEKLKTYTHIIFI